MKKKQLVILLSSLLLTGANFAAFANYEEVNVNCTGSNKGYFGAKKPTDGMRACM